MSDNDEIRWQQRLDSFTKAFAQLKSACSQESYSDLERAGLLKTFELSFELSWKVLKDLLFYEGYKAKSPREVIRRSFEAEYLSEEDTEIYLDALNKRNLLSHTYEEETALLAEKLIKKQYYPLLLRLHKLLNEKLQS